MPHDGRSPPEIGTLLAALQFADSAFPGGAFAFSHGLEGLPQVEQRVDAERLRMFLRAVIRGRWAPFDRIAVARAHRAADDLDRVNAIDDEVEASSTVAPLRAGSRRQGAALLAAHHRLGTPGATDYRDRVADGAPGHVAVVQGMLWRRLGLDERTAIAMSGHGLVAGLVSAAIRLGLAGVIDGQRLIAAMREEIAKAIDAPAFDHVGLSSFAIHAEVAAMKQAQSDLRLFSN